MRVRPLRLKVAAGLAAVLATAVGCRQEMYDQPRYKTLAKSDFFEDGRAARPVIEGTVARGTLDRFPATGGTADGPLVTALPVPLTRELLTRGRERYGIFCAPCHDETGGGRGMVVRRGYRAPPSLHIERLREAPVGHLYDVMSRGLGAMPDYAQQVPPADRWAIAAYVRALQLSQAAGVADVPPQERAKLETGDRPRFPEGSSSQEDTGGNRETGDRPRFPEGSSSQEDTGGNRGLSPEKPPEKPQEGQGGNRGLSPEKH